MGTITMTKRGGTCVSKSFRGAGTLEVWLLECDVAAYASTDDLAVAGVGAFIDTLARDGKTSTLQWATPAHAGVDTNGQALYACGASVAAMTVSSDALAGELCSALPTTEATTSTAATGVGIFVGVTRA